MTTLGLSSIKATTIAKDADDRRIETRDKAMLLFTFQLLLDKGYVDTAAQFASECSLNLEQYSICENIDLQTIFVDFEAYYNIRFQKFPQYYRKSNANNSTVPGESLISKLSRQRSGGTTRAPKQTSSTERRKAIVEAENSSDSSNYEFQVTGSAIMPASQTSGEKLIKPISSLDFPSDDMRSFAEMIQKEIVVQDLGTKWSDVVGLDEAKTILLESMVYRNEFAEFFGDSMSPWKGLLLYGPPGTGKTMLAKAVASECKTTFFNISSSAIVSKWRGDSEKILKILFELARFHAPSTIFFDEFDALASNRDKGSESDASRRLKSELLQQMDGLLTTSDHEKPIFILCATNLPWELDPAVIRRMEKRIYVSLPNQSCRKEIFTSNFIKTAKGINEKSKGKNSLTFQVDFDVITMNTEGYTGSDIQQIVKDAVVNKFREHFGNKIKKIVIHTQDILNAVGNIGPTVTPTLEAKYAKWESKTRFK